MNTKLSNFINGAMDEVKTYVELTRMCQVAMAFLYKDAYNEWVFTRYMRKVDFPTCSGQVDGVTIQPAGELGAKTAVGLACFDAATDNQFIYAGASVCHPGKPGVHEADRWNRHIGRVIAALRMVQIPIELAGLLTVSQAPWDSRFVIKERRLKCMRYEPWATLANCEAIPQQALPAVVDVIRQTIRHRLALPEEKGDYFTFEVAPFHVAEATIVKPEHYEANCALASALVEKAGNLPMSLPSKPFTDEQRAEARKAAATTQEATTEEPKPALVE